jgi:hypothetical protein
MAAVLRIAACSRKVFRKSIGASVLFGQPKSHSKWQSAAAVLLRHCWRVLALGQKALLTGNSGGADLGKFRLAAYASEEWI